MRNKLKSIQVHLIRLWVVLGAIFMVVMIGIMACDNTPPGGDNDTIPDPDPEPPIIDTTAGANIDLSVVTGPATHRGSGFLWSISYDEPHDTLVKPLKIQLFRSRITPWAENTGLATIMRLEEYVPRIQVVLSDEYNLRFPYKPPPPDAPSWAFFYSITQWPGDDGDYSLWEDVIEDAFDLFQSKGIDVEWDFWEEPNWYGWWEPSRERFFETWKVGAKKLRNLDPDAILVGPSISGFDKDYLESFLLYAQVNNVLPDVLSWHEIHNGHPPSEIPENVEYIKDFMARNGIEIDKFDINEVVAPVWQANPGMHVSYLANMEEAGVYGACKATWREGDLYNASVPTLGGFLSYPDLKPRPTWWVMKTYGDITGDLVKVTPDSTMEAIAGVDDDAGELRILVGRGGSHAVRDNDVLKIRNLSEVPWLSDHDSLHVVARHIPYLGYNTLETPERIIDGHVEVQQDVLRLHMPEAKHYDAIAIVVKPPY